MPNSYDIPSATNMINDFYQLEETSVNMDFLNQKCTLKMQAPSLSLFNALSERFDVSRFDLLQGVLDNAALEMFEALSPEDQKIISEKADAQTTKYISDQGVKTKFAGIDTYHNEDGTWREMRLMIQKQAEQGEE